MTNTLHLSADLRPPMVVISKSLKVKRRYTGLLARPLVAEATIGDVK
jgi:hypothetical protein